MSTFIEKLHKKPKHTRKRIAFAATTFITFLIFLFWAASFPSSLPKKRYADLSPLGNLKNTVAATYASIVDTLSVLKTEKESAE
jgi:hypothetical protein